MSLDRILSYPSFALVAFDPITSISAVRVIIHIDLMAEMAELASFPAIFAQLADRFVVQL